MFIYGYVKDKNDHEFRVTHALKTEGNGNAAAANFNVPMDIIQEAFERLFISILIEHGRESLVELVERFHAGEDIVRPLEALAHGIRHLHLFESRIQSTSMGIDELLNFRFCQHLDAELRPFLRIERAHHAVEQF